MVYAVFPFFQAGTKEISLTVDPVVFVVGDEYQIVWHTTEPSIGWVSVGENVYEDSSGGTMKTLEKVHKVSVPMAQLDTEKSYTVHAQKVEREPYVVELGTLLEKTYIFRPIDESDGIHIYNLSDNHSSLFPAADTAAYWGDKLDLLILNGDIANDLMTEDDLVNLINLAAEVTKGGRPVLYTRGNHETRGAYAEQVHKYVGFKGEDEFYFTTRLGSLYLMVLDFAEDKADSHKEYYGLARFEEYRNKQTKFIKNVIENKDTEYEASGVKYKLLISHIRVNNKNNWHEKFHKEWTNYANEIKPDLHLSGHSHRLSYMLPAVDSEYNPDNPDGSYGDSSYAHNFTVVMGSKPPGGSGEDSEDFIATAVLLKDDSIDLWFTNQDHEIIEHHKVK
ncbi:MAG TPA: metallophosphoesterase [Oscillospiraceae bacterium]|nr:metallophosphoesterase [Oscillospiraceae bacterium]